MRKRRDPMIDGGGSREEMVVVPVMVVGARLS